MNYKYETFDDFIITLAGNLDEETLQTCKSVWNAARLTSPPYTVATRGFLKSLGWKEDPHNGQLSYGEWRTFMDLYDNTIYGDECNVDEVYLSESYSVQQPSEKAIKSIMLLEDTLSNRKSKHEQ